MASLWTPGGEHKVSPKPEQPDTTPDSSPDAASSPDDAEVSADAIAAVLPEGTTLDDLTPEQRAEATKIVKEMTAARERLLNTPATTIVANHAMGLYELAALHLSQDEPDFAAASLAIDSVAAIVERLGGRLGEYDTTISEALDRIRMAFVQIKNRAGPS